MFLQEKKGAVRNKIQSPLERDYVLSEIPNASFPSSVFIAEKEGE